MPINFPKVIDINVIFIRSIVFFEHWGNFLLILVEIGFRAYCFEELAKTDTPSALGIKLCD